MCVVASNHYRYFRYCNLIYVCFSEGYIALLTHWVYLISTFSSETSVVGEKTHAEEECRIYKCISHSKLCCAFFQQ